MIESAEKAIPMVWGIIVAVLPVVGVASGIALGWAAKKRTDAQDKQAREKELQAEAATDSRENTLLKRDIEYIKTGIDEIKGKQTRMDQKFDDVSERCIRNEESTKSAHKRIDKLEDIVNSRKERQAEQ